MTTNTPTMPTWIHRSERLPVKYLGQDAFLDAVINRQIASDTAWAEYSCTVECPTCSAPKGMRCNTRSGYHIDRRRRALNAEQFECAGCGKGIRGTHYIVGGWRVSCEKCMQTRTNPKAHAVV